MGTPLEDTKHKIMVDRFVKDLVRCSSMDPTDPNKMDAKDLYKGLLPNLSRLERDNLDGIWLSVPTSELKSLLHYAGKAFDLKELDVKHNMENENSRLFLPKKHIPEVTEKLRELSEISSNANRGKA